MAARARWAPVDATADGLAVDGTGDRAGVGLAVTGSDAIGVDCGDGTAVSGPELEIGSGVVKRIGESVITDELGANDVGANDTAAVVPVWFDDAQPATVSAMAKAVLTNPIHRRASIGIPFRSTPGTRPETIWFRQLIGRIATTKESH